MVIYKKTAVEKNGFLVKLYRFDNSDEQTIFLKFQPEKVDGHSIELHDRKVDKGA